MTEESDAFSDDADDLEDDPEWSYDADLGSNDAGVLGTFLDDLDVEVDDEAIATYMPILPPTDEADDDSIPLVYLHDPMPSTADEHYMKLPARARARFWTYRRELYEQMAYALVRFADTELGDAWLRRNGWHFHTINFASGTPQPMTQMDMRHMSRREAGAHAAKLDMLSIHELSKLASWQDALHRCTMALLGDSAAHAVRISVLLLADSPTNEETKVLRNLANKAGVFLGPEYENVTDWKADAMRTYAI